VSVSRKWSYLKPLQIACAEPLNQVVVELLVPADQLEVRQLQQQGHAELPPFLGVQVAPWAIAQEPRPHLLVADVAVPPRRFGWARHRSRMLIGVSI